MFVNFYLFGLVMPVPCGIMDDNLGNATWIKSFHERIVNLRTERFQAGVSAMILDAVPSLIFCHVTSSAEAQHAAKCHLHGQAWEEYC